MLLGFFFFPPHSLVLHMFAPILRQATDKAWRSVIFKMGGVKEGPAHDLILCCFCFLFLLNSPLWQYHFASEAQPVTWTMQTVIETLPFSLDWGPHTTSPVTVCP